MKILVILDRLVIVFVLQEQTERIAKILMQIIMVIYIWRSLKQNNITASFFQSYGLVNLPSEPQNSVLERKITKLNKAILSYKKFLR